MVAYTFTFKLGYISVTFITAGATGYFFFSFPSCVIIIIYANVIRFFVTGYLPVGFEYAAELTYPEPEATSSGLLNMSANLFGMILIVGCGKLFDDKGDLACNATLSGALLFGAIMSVLIRSDLRRQRANQQQEEQGIAVSDQ